MVDAGRPGLVSMLPTKIPFGLFQQHRPNLIATCLRMNTKMGRKQALAASERPRLQLHLHLHLRNGSPLCPEHARTLPDDYDRLLIHLAIDLNERAKDPDGTLPVIPPAILLDPSRSARRRAISERAKSCSGQSRQPQGVQGGRAAGDPRFPRRSPASVRIRRQCPRRHSAVGGAEALLKSPLSGSEFFRANLKHRVKKPFHFIGAISQC